MPKILIVDDEPDMVAVMKLTLETKGFEAVCAYDGEEGFAKAKEASPDLIILDVLIPKVFGNDVASMLKEDPQTCSIPILFFTNLPVQFLTGSERNEEPLQRDSKGNLYLQKTCTEEELLGAINQVLSRNKS